jgi:hypothetical protein
VYPGNAWNPGYILAGRKAERDLVRTFRSGSVFSSSLCCRDEGSAAADSRG